MLLFIAISALCASGQVPIWSADDVDARIDDLREFELLSGFYIEFSEYSWVRDAEQTVSELHSQVSDKPDHPMRREYDTAAYQIQHGPDEKRWRFWYWSPSLWRVSIR